MLIQKLGHFSKTSKMPCPSYSTSAFDCITTDPLCLKYCYAKKHHYNMNNVKSALAHNTKAYLNKNWTEDFSFYIKNILDLKFFRWFDSGDLYNIMMFDKICEIADNCKGIKFWLPTRRKDLLIAHWEANNKVSLKKLHPNLIIRFSAKDVNVKADTKTAKKIGVNVSTVTDGDNYTCNAKDQGGKCLDCRDCWKQSKFNVRYALH